MDCNAKKYNNDALNLITKYKIKVIVVLLHNLHLSNVDMKR